MLLLPIGTPERQRDLLCYSSDTLSSMCLWYLRRVSMKMLQLFVHYYCYWLQALTNDTITYFRHRRHRFSHCTRRNIIICFFFFFSSIFSTYLVELSSYSSCVFHCLSFIILIPFDEVWGVDCYPSVYIQYVVFGNRNSFFFMETYFIFDGFSRNTTFFNKCRQ